MRSNQLCVATLSVLLLAGCLGDAGSGHSDLGPEQDAATAMDVPRGDAAPAGFQPITGSPFPWSTESTDPACGNGLDDDGNSYTDCDDYACSRSLAVTVCANAWYEASPAACTNGLDDDGDGRADCKDPDCRKNPFHDVCDKPAHEGDCAGTSDTDGDGLAGCDDHDCLLTHPGCDTTGRPRILFDRTLDESAALGPNSDWIVDSWGRLPYPSNPQGEDNWSGGLSALGFALHGDGWLVESLTPWGGALTFGDDDNPQDLSRYDVLVLWEPSRGPTPKERDAVVSFVLAGGGLLAAANHLGADRDGNGWAAPQVLNDILDQNTVQADPFGFRFDLVDESTAGPVDAVTAPGHPVIDGPHGTVTRIGFYQGCTATITDPDVATALLVLDAAETPDAGGVVAGAATPGAGRVVFLTDSAIAGDGTDSHGNKDASKNAWGDPDRDHQALLRNALDWLIGTGS